MGIKKGSTRGVCQFFDTKRYFYSPGAVLTLSLSLLNFACSQSGSSSTPESRVITLDYSMCSIDPRVGPSANQSLANAESFAESGQYDKLMNKAQIQAVLSTSLVSTLGFIQAAGVDISKAPSFARAGDCPNAQQLPPMSGVAEETWKKVAPQVGSNNPNSTDFLAGLYFDNCSRQGSTKQCQKDRVVAPTIVVLENADRWTVVHELMHYSFDQGRKSSGLATPQSIEQVLNRLDQNLQRRLALYKLAKNETDLVAAIAILEQAIPLFETLVKQYGPVEEIAVEAYLIDQWAKGTLQLVQNQAAVSAFFYIKSSADRASQGYRPLYGPVFDLIQEAESEGFSIALEKANSIKTELDRLEGEIKQSVIHNAQVVSSLLNIPIDRLLDPNPMSSLRLASLINPVDSEFVLNRLMMGTNSKPDGWRSAGHDSEAGAHVHSDDHDAHGAAHGQIDIAELTSAFQVSFN